MTDIPQTQKTVLCHQEGTPYVVEERPVPRPAPGEVLVKIMACALNPIDYGIVNPPYSRVLITSWPYVPGGDGAGVVVQLGLDVANIKEGDRVVFKGHIQASQRSATCQQYAVVPAGLTAPIPAHITFDQAATIPVALTTDMLVLYNQSPAPENLSLRLIPIWEPEGTTAYAGTPAFIVGGASSLGQYAIQLAKLAGHDPIITTASPHNAAHLRSLGATHVLDRARPNASILAELPQLTAGKPILYAFVAVSAVPDACRLGRDALATGGALATVMPSPAHIPADVANPGDGKRVGYVLGNLRLPYTRDTAVAVFKQLTRWLDEGLLKPIPVEVLPSGLEGIPEGLERMKAGKVSGRKLVARPQETA